ncbi:hypothetical protein EIN_017590 [Entamoeba invadens IP1]|uniref:hypothetical protein n=1 Tax=Entamoeba invadens IP1 TaxID=370355 RepID=UPI0002C3DE77|nr:hypothetical protein EIN_017590 [Entamoeba invadens IP1]ELP90460.1 hypothetical protein EIN_017590 [Entamoeba invadens IP1]|eukprot:XP_004257231.1 hypothetical protein EIN_017590 [Entamoeba invadens IP1]
MAQIEDNHCTYCEFPTQIQCDDCGIYFCNGKIEGLLLSHIMFHLSSTGHKNVKYKGQLLCCCNCEDSNIFNLKFFKKEDKEIVSSIKTGGKCEKESKQFENKETKCPEIHEETDKKVICHTCLRNDTIVAQANKGLYSRPLVLESVFHTEFFVYEVGADVTTQYVRNFEHVTKDKGDGTNVTSYYDNINEYWATYDYFIRKEEEVDDKITSNIIQGVFFVLEAASVITKGNFYLFDDKFDDRNYDILEDVMKKVPKFVMGRVIRISNNEYEINIDENYFDFPEGPLKEKTKLDEELLHNFKLVRLFFFTRFYQTTQEKFYNFVEENRGNPKIDELLGKTCQHKPDKYNENDIEAEQKKVLNLDQIKAILNGMNNKISIIIGPPGTGKTKCASVMCKTLLENLQEEDKTNRITHTKRRLLCMASSNSATDVLQTYLHNEDLHVLRLLPYDSIGEVDEQILEDSIYKVTFN